MLGNMLSALVNGNRVHSGIFKGCHLDMGSYGIDTPKPLIDAVMDNLASNHNSVNSASKLQAIVINGDFPKHKTGLKKAGTLTQEKQAWNQIASLMNHTLQEFWTRLPGVPVLPSVGNNDLFQHN